MQVGQALTLAASSNLCYQPVMPAGANPGMGGLSAELQAHQHPQQAMMAQMAAAAQVDGMLHAGPGPGSKHTRVYVCSKDDSLRTVRVCAAGFCSLPAAAA